MNRLTSCPDYSVFQKLRRGEASPGVLADLAQHTDQCAECALKVAKLGSDTVVSARREAGKRNRAERSLVELLIEKCQASASSMPANPGTVSAPGSTGPDAPHPAAADDELAFLAPAEAANEIGRLGNYRVIQVLGRGGMGVVLAAEDVRLKRRVALKVMKPHVAANETQRQRFLREAQASAAVEHDHIVKIFEIGEENGVPFIAMPFLKGEALNARLKRGRFNVAEIVNIGRQTAEGLAAAHAHGLIHRDIKPGNIWLETCDDSTVRAKILDFGLVHVSGENQQLTQSGAVMGTPAYMAPEQARGRPVDHRADLFSLGTVLYEMATGQRPFTGADAMAILTSLAVDTPAEPHLLNGDLPAGLSQLIMKLLAKHPAKRPASAGDVAAALKKLLPKTGVIVVSPPPPVASPWAGIDASQTDLLAPPPSLKPRAANQAQAGGRGPEKKLSKRLLLGIGLAAVCLIVVAAIFRPAKDANNQNKAGAGKESPDAVATPTSPRPSEKKKPIARADPERTAAQWVLSCRGAVKLAGAKEWISAADNLPNAPFALKYIRVQNQKDAVTDKGLETVRGLPNLTHVDLNASAQQVTDRGLAVLAEIQTLTNFRLSQGNVTDAGLKSLRGLRQLRTLDLDMTRMTADAVIDAARDSWPELRELHVGGLSITDAGLKGLAQLPSLSKLSLPKSTVSDDQLVYLSALGKLSRLDLTHAPVTDAGLAHLKKCGGLKSLLVTGTKISAAGLAQLKEALPACKFDSAGASSDPE